MSAYEDPPAGAPPARGRRWMVLVVVAAIALLVGAAATAAVFVVSDRFGQPRHEYRVAVFLDHDITAGQKAAVEAALGRLPAVNAITFESREQAWAKFQEAFKGQPDLVAKAKPEDMPESFRLTTTGAEFDCAALAPVRALPGVDMINVVRPAKDGDPGVVVDCA